jgi:site-specific DNA recombinase
MAPLKRFFEQRVFGDGRKLLLARSINEPSTDNGVTERIAALTTDIASLQRRQDNLVAELEQFEPSEDDDFDQAWRSGIQVRFRTILAEQRKKKDLLAELVRQGQARPTVDLSLLDTVPTANIDVGRLPEERQRRLYDAFHLELRYNDLTGELDLRVTITGDTATELGATIQAVLGTAEAGDPALASDDLVADPLRARGGTRTRTPFGRRF